MKQKFLDFQNAGFILSGIAGFNRAVIVRENVGFKVTRLCLGWVGVADR